MSWFGLGGGNNDKSNDQDKSKMSNYDTGFDAGSGASFGAPSAAPTPMGGGSFEEDLMMEQQKLMVQAVMFRLTEMSFEKCVTKPSSALSSSEQSCINSVVGKYLDASQFVVQKFQSSAGGQQY